MNIRTRTVPHESSAWLRDALAARVEVARPYATPDTTVVTPLGRTGDPGSRQDRTCDRCGTYAPPTADDAPLAFYTAAHRTRAPLGGEIIVVLGLCRRCAGREGWSL